MCKRLRLLRIGARRAATYTLGMREAFKLNCGLRLAGALLAVCIAAWPAKALFAQAKFPQSQEYRLIGYDEAARHNPVARLQEALASGHVSLEYKNGNGYLASLLAALNIASSSQTLVFSATSLQRDLIGPHAPRALYFNDSTYVGFVQNSTIIEIITIDERLGIVFYTFDNRPETRDWFQRAGQTCLVCHDSQGSMSGGVPMLMALSAAYSLRNQPLKNFSGAGNVEDSMPIADRWGGWYVTGRHGLQAHLGNVLLQDRSQLDALDDYRTWNIDTLDGGSFFDTSRYLQPTSDIVALLLLEHQLTVQNQLTYISFKIPAAFERSGLHSAVDVETWDDLPARGQRLLARMLDKLVHQLMMVDYAPIASRIRGNADYERWFSAQGPTDSSGRSLRELALQDALFVYPLSFMVYTSGFDAMPSFARDYVYRQLAACLSGRASCARNAFYSQSVARDALEILADTKPEFATYLEAR